MARVSAKLVYEPRGDVRNHDANEVTSRTHVNGRFLHVCGIFQVLGAVAASPPFVGEAIFNPNELICLPLALIFEHAFAFRRPPLYRTGSEGNGET